MGDSKASKVSSSSASRSITGSSTTATIATTTATLATTTAQPQVSTEVPGVKRKKSTASKAPVRTARRRIEAGMPEVYGTGQDIIESFKTVNDTVIQDSDEMKQLKLNIEMLQSFLSNPMPPIAKNKRDEAQYKEELDSVNLAISMMYNKLVLSMDTWLNKSDKQDSTDERVRMITELKDQVLNEESLFAESIRDYRSRLLGNKEAIRKGPETWAEMLRYERSMKIDIDADPKCAELTGGGTSNVLKINKDGRTWYFKEEEDVMTGDPMAIADNILAKHANVDPDFFRGFKNALARDYATYQNDHESFYRILHSVYERIDDKSVSYYDAPSEVTTFIKSIQSIWVWRKRKVFNAFFRDFFKSINQKSIAENIAGIDEGSNLSRRNVATSRLAHLMGIGDMFAESRTAMVQKDGKIMRGNLMEDAEGQHIGDVGYEDIFSDDFFDDYQENVFYSRNGMNQFMILQVFDILCGQIDRHSGNYMVKARSDGSIKLIDSIKCIDNDMAFGKLSFQDMVGGRHESKPLTPDLILAMPPKFRETILSMDAGFMKLILMDLLKPEELDFLEERLNGLKNYITLVINARNARTRGKNELERAKETDPDYCRLKFLRDLLNGMDSSDDQDFVEQRTLLFAEYIPDVDAIEEGMRKREDVIRRSLAE